MKIKNLAFLVFLTIGTFGGCEDKTVISKKDIASTKQTTNNTIKKAKPIFTLTTYDNKKISFKTTKNGWIFEQYKGKILLLDFFATWCPPCKKEIPHLNNLKKYYNGKFDVIGLDIGNRDGSINTPQQIKKFINKLKIKYPITLGRINNELFSNLMYLNKGGSIPFMLLFDDNGKFITSYIGMVPEEKLKTKIDQLIK